MTGVTALVRATAVTMELKGSAYPGEKMRDLFREADIMHVSNEIPFFTGCPYPKADASGPLVFCSDPKYMDLLTDIGTDVIELTGNHFADYGPNAMYETLDIYQCKRHPLFRRRTGLAGFAQTRVVRSQREQDRIHRLQQTRRGTLPDRHRLSARRCALRF